MSGKDMSGENQEVEKNCITVYNTRKHIEISEVSFLELKT